MICPAVPFNRPALTWWAKKIPTVLFTEETPSGRKAFP